MTAQWFFYTSLFLLLISHDQTLGEKEKNSTILPPPMNVKASKNIASARTEISWTLPAESEDSNVTGYSIFFDNGDNISISSWFVTSIGVAVDIVEVGDEISIRSESEDEGLLPSELVSVIVSETDSRSGVNRAAAALGVLLLLAVFSAMAIVATLLLRPKLPHHSTTKLRKAFKKHMYIYTRRKEPAMSDNVAYGQVSITDTTSYTEDIDMTNGGGTVGEDRPHPVYEDINYSELVD